MRKSYRGGMDGCEVKPSHYESGAISNTKSYPKLYGEYGQMGPKSRTKGSKGMHSRQHLGGMKFKHVMDT